MGRPATGIALALAFLSIAVARAQEEPSGADAVKAKIAALDLDGAVELLAELKKEAAASKCATTTTTRRRA